MLLTLVTSNLHGLVISNFKILQRKFQKRYLNNFFTKSMYTLSLINRMIDKKRNDGKVRILAITKKHVTIFSNIKTLYNNVLETICVCMHVCVCMRACACVCVIQFNETFNSISVTSVPIWSRSSAIFTLSVILQSLKNTVLCHILQSALG